MSNMLRMMTIFENDNDIGWIWHIYSFDISVLFQLHVPGADEEDDEYGCVDDKADGGDAFYALFQIMYLYHSGVSVVQLHVSGANDENHRDWS